MSSARLKKEQERTRRLIRLAFAVVILIIGAVCGAFVIIINLIEKAF